MQACKGVIQIFHLNIQWQIQGVAMVSAETPSERMQPPN